MSRPLIVLVLALALAVVLLFTADPLGFFVEDAVDHDPVPENDAELVEDPMLAGRRGATAASEATTMRSFEPVGALEFDLGTATLIGQVTGEGMPLGEARVHVVLAPPNEDRGVRTLADGTWEIRGLPGGSHEVRATHREYQGRSTVVPSAPEDATTRCEALDLTRRKESNNGLVVKVTDAFGRPIVGAKVLATTLPWALHTSIGPELHRATGVLDARGTTKQNGEAWLTRLAPETYDVVATAPGFQVSAQAGVKVQAGRTRHMVFRLERGATITGTVVGPDDQPVEGGFVSGLHQPSFMMAPTAITAKDGSFALEGLRKGSYWLFAGADGEGDAQANPVASPSQGLRLQLGGAGTVEVEVKRPDGTPVSSYHVRPFKAEWFGYTYSMTYPIQSEDGKGELELAPGTWTLSVSGAEGDVAADTQVTVKVGETATTTIQLPTSASVTGVVVDPDGRHLAEAEVYIRMGGIPGGPRREQYARTDADGAFQVKGLPLEVVKLRAEHGEHAYTTVEVDLTSGKPPAELTIQLPRGGVIEGRVTRGDTPVAGEQINVFQMQNMFTPSSTTTDASGAFRVEGVAAGTWSVSTGRYEQNSGGVSKNGVVVTDGGTATVNLELRATEGTQVLTGVVTQGGEPVADASVSVIDGRGYTSLISVRTDSGGAFTAEGVQPGRVVVEIATNEGTRATEYVEVPAEGEAPTARIELAVGTVRGRLLTVDGTPISAAWIQIEVPSEEGASGWGNVKAQITSDPEGYFVAGGLEPGRYQVRVSGSGHAGMLSKPFEVGATGAVDLGTFRLETGVSLQGRVVDDQGAPVEDATISLHDQTGRPVHLFSFVTTGSDGRYAVTGLEPGHYTVGFEAPGFAPATKEIDVASGAATVDGVLSAGGAVEVTILTEGGDPVAGVRIGLRDASGHLVERTLSLVSIFLGEIGRANPEGVARVPDLAPGSYTVTLRSPGWTLVGDAPRVQVSARQTASTQLVVRSE